ncbi:glutamate receptor U1-like [Palaemon carinicauda]|uniref:glutamate receptor U1-like n=1 Tax=Palaemon carinicauda TaxID=392227 RepID=UPI0035B64778
MFNLQVISQLQPEFGIRLYEVKVESQRQRLNETRQQLSDIVRDVIKWKYSYECVSLVASSNDVIFLDLFASAYEFDRQLFWRLRPFIVTGVPLQQLRGLLLKHWVLFASGSMVLRVPEEREKGGRLIEIYTHLPYGPEEGGRDVRVATWSQHRGILTTLEREKYRIRQPTDGQWGSLNDDGTWTGLVGQVFRHEADFAVGPHDVTEVRSKAIDYTANLIFDARKFIVAQNRAKVNPWGFLFPLSPKVYLGILLALCLMAVMTIAVGKRYIQLSLGTYAYAVTFHTYRLLLQQGLTMNLSRISERLLVGSWLVATMIICWSYSSNLISLLAVRYAPRPIQTIRDLLNHKTLIVIFPRRTSLSDYLFSVESGQLKEVADLSKMGRYIDLPFWEFPQGMETYVSKGTHIMATDTIDARTMIANYFSETGRCQFYIAREAFVHYVLAMVAQKGSPLVAAMNKRIRAVFEAGLYQYWLNKNVPNSTSCDHMPSTFTVREPLSLANIWGLFVLLLSGLLLSLMIFCSEIISAKLRPYL